MHKNKFCSSGFGLMEVLIASGLMIVLAVGMAQLMQFNARSVKSLQSSADFTSLITTLQSALGNPDNCLQMLGNQSFNPPATVPGTMSQDLLEIRTNGATGSVIVPAPGNKFGSSLKINELKWIFASSLGSPGTYLGTLKLSVDKLVAGGAVGVQGLHHEFRIALTIDSRNKIIGCSGDAEVLWKKIPTGSDIYYDTGNVGIGTQTPRAKLQVEGTIRAGNAVTGALCSPEGAMGYDLGAHAAIYCSQTGWKQFGGGAQIDYSVCTTISWGVRGGGDCPANYVLVSANYRPSDTGEWNTFKCCKLK